MINGMSFAIIPSIAAEQGISNLVKIEQTINEYEAKGSLMLGNYRVLLTRCSPGEEDQSPPNAPGWGVIGKGLAWEMLYNALSGKGTSLLIYKIS